MDQGATEQLTGRLAEHRRNIEDTVREIEGRISPSQVRRRWVESGKGVVEDLKAVGFEESAAYQGLHSTADDGPHDATLVLRGMITRQPAGVGAVALLIGFLVGGIGR